MGQADNGMGHGSIVFITGDIRDEGAVHLLVDLQLFVGPFLFCNIVVHKNTVRKLANGPEMVAPRLGRAQQTVMTDPPLDIHRDNLVLATHSLTTLTAPI